MIIHHLPLSKYTSNIFILEKIDSSNVWLIDIGDFEPLKDKIPGGKTVAGVFLTHPHYDHIGGINELLKHYPKMQVLGSGQTLSALNNPKENLSFYHEEPVVFSGSSCVVLDNLLEYELYQNVKLEIFQTPGHYTGSLTFKLDNYWFTGDSLVPGYPVVTKLKGGDRRINQVSLDRLFGMFSEDDIICSGHGEMVKAKTLNRNDYL